MFFTNDSSSVAGIFPMAGGSVDQLTRSFPTEFTVGVNLDEIVQPCSKM